MVLSLSALSPNISMRTKSKVSQYRDATGENERPKDDEGFLFAVY